MTVDLDTQAEPQTEVEPAAPVVQVDFSQFVEAFSALARTIGEALSQIGSALAPVYAMLRKYEQYIEGAGRCYGPPPLSINGHAYHRRLRSRRGRR